MRDARFTIPSAQLLSRVVDMLDDIPMQDRDTNGDLHEYMLSKIATAGTNGQFRTPRAHHPADGRDDRAQAAAQDLRSSVRYGRLPGRCGRAHSRGAPLGDDERDAAPAVPPWHVLWLRLRLHHAADWQHKHAPARRRGPRHPVSRLAVRGSQRRRGEYTLVLANPPFAGSLDYESISKDLQRVVKTKKTKLLFLALFLRLLKPGGRAAVIVPDGVLFGSSKAHKELRRILVEDQKLDAVVKLPSGTFRPYAGVSTTILLFTKTNSGGTDNVWFYDLQADGWSPSTTNGHRCVGRQARLLAHHSPRRADMARLGARACTRSFSRFRLRRV